ncbi:MAG: hypothetical protein HYZ27_05770 [Deltaproteobacteria bacterium]|nr:hypothetical protein [Deltaproteobacteria bacterium]
MSTTAAAESEAAPARHDLLRIGPTFGGVLPRGDLEPTFMAGLLADLPVTAVRGIELSAYGEVGWSPLRQQDDVIIPGRGQTQLVQNTQVFLGEAGLRASVRLSELFYAHAALGLAIDVTRTELKAFSLPAEAQNDLAWGPGGGLGVLMSLGPGALLAEIRYRELTGDLGGFNDIGEPALGRGTLHVGYLFALPAVPPTWRS